MYDPMSPRSHCLRPLGADFAINTGILAQWEHLMCHTDQPRAKKASLSLVELLEEPRIVIVSVALYGGRNAQSRHSV